MNKLQEPEGSTPLHEIIDEYADSNDAFIRDFIPVLEKMLANGYDRYLLFYLWVLIYCLLESYFIAAMSFKIHLITGLGCHVEDLKLMTDGGTTTVSKTLR